jgi:NAD(P)-dependent dehydrogenase (short-subunit alcohol dehydrogenase family)
MAFGLSPQGSRVNTSSPTFIRTPMAKPFLAIASSTGKLSPASHWAESARPKT